MHDPNLNPDRDPDLNPDRDPDLNPDRDLDHDLDRNPDRDPDRASHFWDKMKGLSSWLWLLPLKDQGFNLNI